jgi:hypothetical protein
MKLPLRVGTFNQYEQQKRLENGFGGSKFWALIDD